MRHKQFFAAAAVLIMAAAAHAQTVPSGFTVEAYGGSVPDGTTMVWAPDGRLFIGQIDGAVRVLRNGAVLSAPFHSLTVNHPAGTERGLLGICVDPGYLTNGFVYVYFTNPTPAPHNCIRRLRANPSNRDVSDGSETPILDLEILGSDTMHNGGSIGFGTDGKLYVAVGDNADANHAQSLSSRLGKLLRLNADGSVPGDNPTSFANLTGSPMNEFRSIWAVGLRNPFRFAIQPGSGRIYINDVGVDTWEEIDDGMAGANYGWEGGNTDGARGLPGFMDPVFQYGHSGAPPTGIAITGGAFYNPVSVQFPARFVGRYFFADYGAGFIYSIDPAAPGVAEQFLIGAPGIVDLQVGPDGALYYLKALTGGGVFRISTTAGAGQIVDTDEGSGGSGGGGCGTTGLEPLFLLLLLIPLRALLSAWAARR